MTNSEKKVMNLVVNEVLKAVKLHTPSLADDDGDDLSEYGQGARDALVGFLRTFKDELDRMKKVKLSSKK